MKTQDNMDQDNMDQDNKMTRREMALWLGQAGLALSAGSLLGTSAFAAASPVVGPVPAAPVHSMEDYGIPAGPPQQIAMLVYPQMTALDLVGPYQILASMMNVNVHLVWKTRDIVTSDVGLPIQPTTTLGKCPDDLTALFVPGGAEGTLAVMNDDDVLDFLARRGNRARYVTSVCTGSLVLGAAGLLRGYRATSHWSFRDMLSLFGATPVAERVVEDRNRITGAGVTAGLDFGLHLTTLLRNERMARAMQLSLEYDPQPPYHAGTPATAGADVVMMEQAMFAPMREKVQAAALRTQRRRA